MTKDEIRKLNKRRGTLLIRVAHARNKLAWVRTCQSPYESTRAELRDGDRKIARLTRRIRKMLDEIERIDNTDIFDNA